MRQPPCKDCPSKGCGPKHDTCAPYQQWLADHLAYKQEAGRQRMIQNAISESVLRIRRKAKK